MSATALVRVNRGSTWIMVAPRSFAFITQRKPDRVALRHVRSLDHDAVRVLQILLKRGRAASAERCPQTGDGGGVSNTGLIFYLDDTQ